MQVSGFLLIKKLQLIKKYPVKVFVCMFSCEHVGIPVFFFKKDAFTERFVTRTASVVVCLIV